MTQYQSMDTSDHDLHARWQQRVDSGTFSAGVEGLGNIRVMGRSGDTPLAFPRIASLDLLPSLEPDEQWALRQAEAALLAAQRESRTVFNRETSAVVTEFDPHVAEMLIVSRIAGGRR